ncbi:MAG: VWA domain-containing protein, partial [Acidobacteria bacterium]|nr:VWA domain-containing protein [Acidobacteriota bacterium]
MKRLFVIAVVLAASVVLSFGQSGRRVAAAAAESPPVESEGEYSESKPAEKRPIYRRPVKAAKKDQKAEDKQSVIGTPTTIQGTDADGEAISVETNLVTIPVSVFDRNGLYIPNLRRNDFKVFEDGEEQDLTYFGTTEQPFTVVLLLDVSPSTAFRIEEIQEGAIAFVDQLKPQDKVMVIEFDQFVNVLAEPTNDRQILHRAIRKADFGSGTSLYGAVHQALQKQLSKIEGRKAIVLFTDGVDTTSGRSTYDSTLAQAEESEAMIFPIYYNT